MKNAIRPIYTALFLALSAMSAQAGSSTADAAIGGGLGGAAGAAIGNELGGRDGAVVGGALGAAVGASVATDGKGDRDRDGHRYEPRPRVYYEAAPAGNGHPFEYHCPPGQRKKGRC